MFPNLDQPMFEVGRLNVEAVKAKLEKEGIRLIGEVVGGCIGRSVELSTATGGVTVRIKI